ncbi:Hypothetical protein POVN_LOCUS536 [uncultured virus]|nr:Hypothetical protein POVN_LOCUS536 [uncultured virus]
MALKIVENRNASIRLKGMTDSTLVYDKELAKSGSFTIVTMRPLKEEPPAKTSPPSAASGIVFVSASTSSKNRVPFPVKGFDSKITITT